MIGVYKIVSPVNKVYIGSSLDIGSRWRRYMGLWSDVKQQRKLWSSLNKYGPSNHTYQVLEETTEELLLVREQWWLDYYTSAKANLLNLAKKAGKPPSWLGKKHSDVTKNKQRAAKLGVPRSSETKSKISKSLTGRSLSSDIIEKTKKTKIENNSWQQGIRTKINNGLIQKIIGFNPKNKSEILHQFNTIPEGCVLGFARVGIGHCVTHRQETHRGVAFLYEKDYLSMINKN